MAPSKLKKSWEGLKYIKKKTKKKLTEEKLRKAFEEQEREKISYAITSNAEDSDFIATVSVAVPGSILDNAQSPELRTYLAGQIARAMCIYQVDEVIVFNDKSDDKRQHLVANNNNGSQTSKSCQNLATILQYLECPQYLRKHLFPLHNSLKYAGLLNPLDAPHHLRKDSKCQFREGVVLTLPPKPDKGSYVDIGLQKAAIIDKVLEPYFRVTVKLNSKAYDNPKRIYGKVVSPLTPKIECGLYWGYSVRIANSLNEIFTKCPYPGGYDLTIGTSDKGTSVDDMENVSNYRHCLIVFGGLNGLEAALENDETLKTEDVSLLFEHYINTCPQQASRTIRTEEAILISLAELRKKLNFNINIKMLQSHTE